MRYPLDEAKSQLPCASVQHCNPVHVWACTSFHQLRWHRALVPLFRYRFNNSLIFLFSVWIWVILSIAEYSTSCWHHEMPFTACFTSAIRCVLCEKQDGPKGHRITKSFPRRSILFSKRFKFKTNYFSS